MSISFACPTCSRKISVSDTAAGKRGKCPGCGNVVNVPGLDDPFAPKWAPAPVTPDPDPDPPVAQTVFVPVSTPVAVPSIPIVTDDDDDDDEKGMVHPTEPRPLRVVVVDFDISFEQLVKLIIKFTLALIPAYLFLAVLSLVIAIVFATLTGRFR